MEDDREISAGDTKLAGIPHAAPGFELRLSALKQLRPGASYYVLFRFSRADKSEIACRSVELIPNSSDFRSSLQELKRYP